MIKFSHIIDIKLIKGGFFLIRQGFKRKLCIVCDKNNKKKSI